MDAISLIYRIVTSSEARAQFALIVGADHDVMNKRQPPANGAVQ
jgi:hypothetical protein